MSSSGSNPALALVFDFDGTLVDSNRIKREGYFAAAAAVGMPVATMDRALVDRPGAQRYLVMTHAIAAWDAAPSDPAEALRRMLSAYSAHCVDGVTRARDVPGAAAAVSALRRLGFRLFINSGTAQDDLRRVVDGRNTAQHFDAVLGSPASKLENLQHLCAQGSLDAAATCVIGDGSDDQAAARAFGCQFIGIGDAACFGEAPRYVLPDLTALPDLVRRVMTPPSAAPAVARA